jgi:asparagine synthase (glutamine-hydrolysing)
MCGIVGMVAATTAPQPERERVAAAVRALRHRGPDGSGVTVLDGAVLGHTRLGIIDLENGAQPMTNEDETVWTVFNGEIWNFPEIRALLSKKGHRFSTRCDTEVLVHGYEEWGDDLPTHLNGMFAFALWDTRRRRLLLARDRIGKKPLYVVRTRHGVAFGSDARSVLLAVGMQPQLDDRHVAEFLFQRYVGERRTLFRGVERLPPGHLFTFDGERVDERAYWSVPAAENAEPIDPRELRELLRDSVRRRLQSDVPVGVFLSGGVDSAAVLGLVREAEAGPLATFTIGFDDPVFDERPLARLTAARFAADAHEVVVGRDDFVEALPRLAWYRDEPIAEPAEIPLLLLAEFAGRHVKVVLSGEGGDELFGGYPKVRAERILGLPTPLPAYALRVAMVVASQRPSHRQFLRAREALAIRDPLLRWASWFRAFSSEELTLILSPRLARQATPERLTQPLRELLEPYHALDSVRRLLTADALTYLADNMLLRGDRVLMAASVEGRMPLLDYRIVELAARAPLRQRAGLRRSKVVLRKAVADLIPPRIQKGPKRGFPVPVARFLLTGSRRLVDDLVLSDRALSRGLFEPDALRKLVGEIRHNPRDSQLRLFTLVSLELWLRTNIDTLRLEPPELLDEVLQDETAAVSFQSSTSSA